MSFENVTSGIAGVTLVAYFSALCDLRFTAAQYALVSAAASIVGRFITGGSAGALIEAMGYVNFYILTAAATLPGVALILVDGADRARRALDRQRWNRKNPILSVGSLVVRARSQNRACSSQITERPRPTAFRRGQRAEAFVRTEQCRSAFRRRSGCRCEAIDVGAAPARFAGHPCRQQQGATVIGRAATRAPAPPSTRAAAPVDADSPEPKRPSIALAACASSSPADRHAPDREEEHAIRSAVALGSGATRRSPPGTDCALDHGGPPRSPARCGRTSVGTRFAIASQSQLERVNQAVGHSRRAPLPAR